METLKNGWKSIWRKIEPISPYLVAASGIIIIGGGVTLFGRHQNHTDKTPTVSQVFEPSIGTPLAPDVNPDAANPQVAGDSTTNYVAPNTGVDDDNPVYYWNDKFMFSAILPPHTNVAESKTGAVFSDQNGQIYYSVDVVPSGEESLASIAGQLRQSLSVTNVRSASFAGWPAISFKTDNQSGYALMSHNFVYYIVGERNLETFGLK